jgi:multidrug efflux pump subunit AcrA (membrane-fusion protein)
VAPVAKPAEVAGSWFQGKNSFTTIIGVNEADPERLRPGMNATVEILSSTEKDVTYIPVDALYQRQEQQFVYRMRDGKFHFTPVETGPRNKDYVVIKKGVKPGDTVSIVFPPEPLIAE